ncbi:MAG: bifunctional diaminohydroxyphosphoribosylaminopyrimidine deaminase/5-amino-6-(5-phosphoribosylamino)uracil reductase RibD [Candidatus Obscuribacterales bacterium]|nr:bifunctional diaminohydroxyphosphoribosylaminopyrimidine deaminase/5-amino-6-(5-phosphoribosylamino)uracil reductase RibD [Candidatus Obscuribacterales bacterium]
MTANSYSDRDRAAMSECLSLASKAEGRTIPNPLVGAVISDAGGNIVGRGYHQKAGGEHAEVLAFKDAGDRAAGGTLYVSLEPCCHHGRTPPCTDLVLKSGVKRVVAGMVDPNPVVAGKGIEQLRNAGLQVDVGLLEEQCRFLNRGFIKRVTKGLPWTILKMAATLDGRIADRDGNSRWITGAEARAHVHELRNKVDCVIIGGHTAWKDDAQLNVRDITDGRDPLKAVIDPQLLVQPQSRFCTAPAKNALTLAGTSTFIFSSPQKIKNAESYGQHIKLVPELDLESIFKNLANAGVQTLLCEGGGRLAGALLEANLIDEICWFVSPSILVDGKGIASLAGTQSQLINERIRLQNVEYKQLGQDLLVSGLVSQETSI